MAKDKRNLTPPTTDLDRELRLYNLTLKQVEKQLENGTASSQIVSHFLTIGSERAKTERKRAELELLLLEQKIASEKANRENEQDLKELMRVLKGYQMNFAEDDGEYDEYYD